jgi:hypothetical protein
MEIRQTINIDNWSIDPPGFYPDELWGLTSEQRAEMEATVKAAIQEKEEAATQQAIQEKNTARTRKRIARLVAMTIDQVPLDQQRSILEQIAQIDPENPGTLPLIMSFAIKSAARDHSPQSEQPLTSLPLEDVEVNEMLDGYTDPCLQQPIDPMADTGDLIDEFMLDGIVPGIDQPLAPAQITDRPTPITVSLPHGQTTTRIQEQRP